VSGTELPVTWQTASHPRVIVRRIDEEVLLFDTVTWRTHLLNATAAQLLALIQQRACSADALAEAVSPGDASFKAEVDGLLEGLAGLGVVQRVPRDA
jgi:PqqD family protein of HPr-rel-A system